MMCFATNSYSQMEFSSAKFKKQPLDTGIKTKSNSSNSCPRDILAPNILKKPEAKFQSTNFKIGDPDPFL
jgi:hypothetical protein